MAGATVALDVLLNGVTIGMVYVLVAAGLSLVFGVMDVLNISHGELLALGAYFAYSMTVGFGEQGFWLALIVVPLLVGGLGVGLERLLIQRVYGRGHLSHILLTFGILLIIYDLKEVVWGPEAKPFAPPAVLTQAVEIAGYSYSLYNYFMIGAGLLLAVATWALLQHTRVGIVIRAGAEDREMVRNLGIDIDRYYMLVFGIGAALAAFGGVVLGGYQNVTLELGNSVIIPAFVIVVLGGLGSFRGAVVAGLFVGLVQSTVATFLPALQGMVVFLLMIGVLLVRPEGLFGGGGERVASGQTAPSEFISDLGGGVLSAQTRRRLGLALVAGLALVPVFAGVLYSRFLLSVLITMLIWGLFAMSLDLILGYAGLISLGHAMFYGLGAYTVILSLVHVSPSALVAVAAALVVSAVAAAIVGRVAIRVSGVYFVMITLGFAQILHQLVVTLDVTGGSNGLFGAPTPLYGLAGVGIRFDQVRVGVPPLAFTGDALFYYLVLAVVIASFLLVRRVVRAPFGTVLQALRESELRAEFIGYEVQSYKRRAFILSGTLAGLAGALFSLHSGYAAPTLLSWVNSGDVILMTILGGAGTLYGPMLGAAVFIFIQEQLSSVLPAWRLLLGALFVAAVLGLPKGVVSLPSRVAGILTERRRGDETDREVVSDD